MQSLSELDDRLRYIATQRGLQRLESMAFASIFITMMHQVLDLIAAHHPDESVRARVKPKGG